MRQLADICVVGDYDSICAFAALGITLYTVTTDDEAEKCIENLAENNMQIIFITENFAKNITHILDKYRTKKTPAIIPIPAISGTNGVGEAYLRRAIEQAVGSADILFQN